MLITESTQFVRASRAAPPAVSQACGNRRATPFVRLFASAIVGLAGAAIGAILAVVVALATGIITIAC